MTVAQLVAGRAAAEPDAVALRSKRLGIWREITWRDYDTQVRRVAGGLAGLGVAPGDRVAILSENRPEWLYADAACAALGAVSVGIDPIDAADEVGRALEQTGATILLAEDQEQVDKALALSGAGLAQILYIEPRGVREYDDPRLVWWPDLLDRSEEHVAEPDVGPGAAATVVAGRADDGSARRTTLSVGDVDAALTELADGGPVLPGAGSADFTVSFLAQSGIADRVSSTWLNAAAGVQLHFAESVATVGVTLNEVQPTLFLAVPRIFEKLHAGAQERMAGATGLKRRNHRLWAEPREGLGRRAASVLLHRPLREHLGLRKCRRAVCVGGCPDLEVAAWFATIGLPIDDLGDARSSVAALLDPRPKTEGVR